MQKTKKTSDEVDAFIASLADDFEQAELTELECAILRYSDKLTRQPQSITETDIQTLRDVGLNDLAIHDLVYCVSYFAFVNRIADGLGVKLEESESP